jgi:hypothetical protein
MRSKSEGETERERREVQIRGAGENIFGSPNLIECALKFLSVLREREKLGMEKKLLGLGQN